LSKCFNLWKVCASSHAEHQRQSLITKLDSCRAIKWAAVFSVHKLHNLRDSDGTT